MATTPDEWLEAQADRVFARQRAAADTAKLVATFATGVAATIVAAGLQVGKPSDADRGSTILLAATAVIALVVILLDRLTEADHVGLLEESTVRGWSAIELIRELRVATVAATRNNEGVIAQMRSALTFQVLAAVATGFVAARGLLA